MARWPLTPTSSDAQCLIGNNGLVRPIEIGKLQHMKTVFVLLYALLLSVSAQQTRPLRSVIHPARGSPPALDANYVVKLTVQRKEKPTSSSKCLRQNLRLRSVYRSRPSIYP